MEIELIPADVLEHAGMSDEKEEADELKKEMFAKAASKVRSAKSDEDFAAALKTFIHLCQDMEY